MAKKKRTLFYNLIIFLCMAVILGCIGALIYIYYPDIQNYQIKKEVQKAASEETGYDWAALSAINPDVIGWLTIPDTIVDYPVVQTDNNDIYLYTSFDGSYNKYGTLFLDCDFEYGADPKMQNSVIYGHASTYNNYQMFASLADYEDESYYQAHKNLYFTRVEDGTEPVLYEIAYVIKEEMNYDYRKPQFATQEEFLAYYERIAQQSLYDTGVTVQPDDEIVTLSTCVFDIDNGRLAVIARRV